MGYSTRGKQDLRVEVGFFKSFFQDGNDLVRGHVFSCSYQQGLADGVLLAKKFAGIGSREDGFSRCESILGKEAGCRVIGEDLKERGVDIIRANAGEGSFLCAGADGCLVGVRDGRRVCYILTGGQCGGGQLGLTYGEGPHMIKVGADAGYAVCVLEMAVTAELALRINEQDKRCCDADG